MARRTAQYEITIEDLDKELIARGAQIPPGELFKFNDSDGTPARDDIMDGVKELYKGASSLSPNPALSLISTDALVKTLIHKTRQIEENRKRGIWYEDHRMDSFGITDERVKRNINCVAAIVFEKDLIDEKNGISTLKVKNYGKSFNLYEGEAFREQPVTAGRVCTGFLVKKNVIATAGHCVCKDTLADLRIVFGYKMSDPYTPVTKVANENIYKVVKIIHKVLNREVNRSDWALVQLDREVEEQEGLTLSEDEIACDQPVYVIGHPAGLPLKYAPGAKVRGFKENFFSADLDTYMGSSGSPVFNDKTHEVIGIVVHGDTRDFRWTGKGWASIIYSNPDRTSKGPQCTRVSQFKDIVDKLP
jgi:V8-like Glu-specific endopeptidase